MKLVNKYTDEIMEFNAIYLTEVVIKKRKDDVTASEYLYKTYTTLKRLNDEWEDYDEGRNN